MEVTKLDNFDYEFIHHWLILINYIMPDANTKKLTIFNILLYKIMKSH